MADALAHALDQPGQVAVHDLRVVQVELHRHVGPVDLLDPADRVHLVGDEVAGDVPAVQRLDQHRDVVAGQSVGGVAHVGDEGFLARRAVEIAGDAGHRMKNAACLSVRA